MGRGFGLSLGYDNSGVTVIQLESLRDDITCQAVENRLPDLSSLSLILPPSPLDSVWPVYILPEEVGARVHAIGVNVIALRSRRSDSQPGQLDIISPTDPAPIVTWDRDKMRRTGCLGNMVFIEIGRRCRGGPGLVWMFAGPTDVAALRETLHRSVLA